MNRQVSLLNQALKRYSKTTTTYPKYAYFMWKNKLSNSNRDYGEMTEQEIIDKYCKGSTKKYANLQQWEKTEEYAELMNLLLLEKSNKDFIDIYDIVSDKARRGDDRAIKTFLLLQNELKKSIKTKKSNKQEEVEDDDLTLD